MTPLVEYRSAEVADVRWPERTIVVKALPYESPTDKVVYKGRNYVESFARGAFNGINERQSKIMVRREHQGPTVGKVERWRDAPEALYCEMRMATTPAAEETLTLTGEGMLFPSVSFYLKRGSDQELNHRSDPARRYIRRAFVSHVALTDEPAYDGVDVLEVRSAAIPTTDAPPQVATPRREEWLEYVQSRRAGLSA